MPPSVIVLGGGIIGLSCAFEAARRGWKVTLAEPAAAGGQASGAAAGMLAPYSENTERPDAFFDLCRESLSLYPEWIGAVEECSGMSAEWVQSGSLSVFRHEADWLSAEARVGWQRQHGSRGEAIDAAALRSLEPGLTPDAAGAVYEPQESHVYAPSLVAALERCCRKLGVALLERAGAIESVVAGLSGVQVHAAAWRRPLTADRVVVCSGAWAGQYEAWLDISIPVHPIRGQICSFAGTIEEVRHMVFSSQAYWVGKRNGRIVCGASEDDAAFRTDTTERGIGRLIRASGSWFPALAERETTHRWAGLRPATPDGWPLLGEIRHKPAVIMATGHYRNGILLSPATAMRVADLLGGGAEARKRLLPFAPDRFGPRGPSSYGRLAATYPEGR